MVCVRGHEMCLTPSNFYTSVVRHEKESVWKLLLWPVEGGKRRGRRAAPSASCGALSWTRLRDSCELHEFLHLEEVKPSMKKIFWC